MPGGGRGGRGRPIAKKKNSQKTPFDLTPRSREADRSFRLRPLKHLVELSEEAVWLHSGRHRERRKGERETATTTMLIEQTSELSAKRFSEISSSIFDRPKISPLFSFSFQTRYRFPFLQNKMATMRIAASTLSSSLSTATTSRPRAAAAPQSSRQAASSACSTSASASTAFSILRLGRRRDSRSVSCRAADPFILDKLKATEQSFEELHVSAVCLIR